MVSKGTGAYTGADVMKKAIAAQDVIYQASTLLSIAQSCGIPEKMTNETKILEDATVGVVGEDRVEIDADASNKRLIYKELRTDIIWTQYPYEITNKAKLNARDLNALMDNNIQSTAEFFKAIKDYRLLTALVASSGATSGATAVWGTASADPEDDVLTALSAIMGSSNIQAGERLTLIVPAAVYYEINKLTLINNIQRTVGDYLRKSFNIDIVPYRPAQEDGSAVYDALTTSALLFVQGKRTATMYTFDPAEAASRNIPLVEQEKVFGRGDRFLQKIGTACLPKWDGMGTYTSSTDFTNYRIYTLTGVSS